ncbi:MAG: glycosyl hydrolase family 18 protein [Bacteroides xylanisolvens]
MKRSIYQTLWGVIIMIIVTTSCSNSSSEEALITNEGPLQSFVIQCGDSYFRRTIDQTSHTISLGGIHRSTDITKVNYQLVEGASIVPDPTEVITWKRTQKFTVSTASGGEIVYTINLPDLKEQGPDPEVYSPVVLGYLPLNDFQFDSQFSHIHWQYLTHVAACFVKVQKDGTLNTEQIDSRIEEVRDKAREKGIKVLISLCKNSPKEFTYAINSPATRSKVVEGIIALVQQYNLDGFDIDYEEYTDDQGTSWWNQYRPALMSFIKELHEAKEKTNPDWLMTSATANPEWLNYGSDWEQYFDFINLMSYDRHTPGQNPNTPGQHASMAHFTGELTYWNHNLGASKEKLLGGLPFYGYTWNPLGSADNQGAIRYYNILSEYQNVPEIETMDHYGRTYWNGPNMIREKCQYVIDNRFGGVIIWQLFMDAKDESPHKLLDIIGTTFIMDNN